MWGADKLFTYSPSHPLRRLLAFYHFSSLVAAPGCHSWGQGLVRVSSRGPFLPFPCPPLPSLPSVPPPLILPLSHTPHPLKSTSDFEHKVVNYAVHMTEKSNILRPTGDTHGRRIMCVSDRPVLPC